jgi:hypothetical protein
MCIPVRSASHGESSRWRFPGSCAGDRPARSGRRASASAGSLPGSAAGMQAHFSYVRSRRCQSLPMP